MKKLTYCHRTGLTKLVTKFFYIFLKKYIRLWVLAISKCIYEKCWFVFTSNCYNLFQLLGSIHTLWDKPTAELAKFVNPSGNKILQGLDDVFPPYEEAMSKCDFTTLESIYLQVAKIYFELLPHIANNKVYNAVYKLANASASFAKRVAQGVSLNDISNFENQQNILFSPALN